MRVHVFLPSARLAPFIERFTLVETGDEAATKTLLPELAPILGFRVRGAAQENGERTPEASIAGLRGAPRTMHTERNSAVLLAIFRTGVAHELIEPPLNELYGSTVEHRAPGTLERIALAPTLPQKLALFEQHLLERHRPERRDRQVLRALELLRAGASIDQIAKAVELSRDRLEKRFRRAVGTTPKHFAVMLRLKKAIALAQAGCSLTAAALDAGYFDQSHFIRDFKQFTGDSPQKFFATDEYC